MKEFVPHKFNFLCQAENQINLKVKGKIRGLQNNKADFSVVPMKKTGFQAREKKKNRRKKLLRDYWTTEDSMLEIINSDCHF